MTFVDYVTPIPADWLNNVNTQVQNIGNFGLATPTTGAALIGYKNALSGAVAQTLQTYASQRVSVFDFGAKGDGLTDDTAAFNTALASNKNVFVPYTAAGYLINGTVTIGTGQWLHFETSAVQILCTATTTTGNPFRLTGFGGNTGGVSGMTGGCLINMNGAPGGSTGIRFGTSTGVVYQVRLYGRYNFINCPEAIGDETSASNYVVDVWIDDVNCTFTRGQQFWSKRSRGFFYIKSFVIDQTHDLNPILWTSARIADFIGVEIERFDVVGGGVGANTYQSGAIGLVIDGTVNGTSLWIKRCLIDNTFGNGVYMTNVLNLVIDEIETYQNLGYGQQYVNCNVGQISSMFCHGGVGVTGASPGQNGIQFQNSNDLQVSNLVSLYNTGDGILYVNSFRNLISNFTVKFNQNIGIVEDATSNQNIRCNGFVAGNAADSLSQNGAASATVNWIANAGIFRVSDVGSILVA